jgi:uncharacterized protein YegJ (DUF2314 family)
MKPTPKQLGLVLAVVGVLFVIAVFNFAQSKRTNIVRVNNANPALQAAIKEAQNGLPEFEKHLSNPKSDEGFAVKGTFLTPEGKEYLWVKSPTFEKGTFTGKLDQQPIAVAGKQKGDTVSFAEKDAVDWLIKDADGIKGAYTEKVLSSQP